jgi:hypothetical protein
MCRICFIIHLVPLVHGNIFVCRNFDQNGDKYTHRRQVDMVGGFGATWAHRLAPQGRRPAPQVPLWQLPHFFLLFYFLNNFFIAHAHL